MIEKLSTQSIVDALGAEAVGEPVCINRVVTDSRKIEPGCLFVALSGDRFDGHDFVKTAQEMGAAMAVVTRLLPDVSIPQLIVKDTLIALGQLGRLVRDLVDIPVIAVTGSAGKTTIKQMCAAIMSLEGKVLATQGNFNNEIGVPLTLFNLNEAHDYAIIEMGAAKAHDIAYLCDIAKPDIVGVCAVLAAHIEGFGSLEGVAKTKGEIYAGVSEQGAAVFDARSPYLAQWRERSATEDQILVSASDCEAADICVSDIEWNEMGLPSFVLSTPIGMTSVTLPVMGEHNIHNAVFASALCYLAGASLSSIEAGLSQFRPAKGRMTVEQVGEMTLIDDTYNANPAAMQKAIDTAVNLGKKTIFVMGDMAELGDDAEQNHADIGTYAREKGIQKLIGVGDLSQKAVGAFAEGGYAVDSIEQANNLLDSWTLDGSVVLVKGSRSAGMEQVVNFLNKAKG